MCDINNYLYAKLTLIKMRSISFISLHEMKIKIGILAFISFLILAPQVLAASSSFIGNAQRWYDSNCTRRPERVRGQESVLCYAYDKLAELDQDITGFNERLAEIDLDNASQSARINDLENTPTLGHKELKTFDSNNIELGIYADTYSFFYPPIQRFLSVLSDTGGFGTGGRIYFINTNCTGDAYKTISGQDMTDHGKFAFNAGDNRFFVVDYGTPNTNINTNSFLDTGTCTNNNSTNSQRQLREVSVSLPNPVALPLQYKYQ